MDSSNKVPQIVQVMYFKGPQRPVSQQPEAGLPQQQENQWQEFMNALQPPRLGGANSMPMEQVPWDDARTFLSAFEQVAEACRWPREEWVGRLLPALRGGVEPFFCQLDPRDRTDFVKVKLALLRADAFRREYKRQHFRQCRYQEMEGPRRIYNQLKELCRQWLKPDKYTKEQILEMIIQEQLLAMLPPEVQSWVKECGPEDCIEMVALAEDFLMGRRSARAWVRQTPASSSMEAEVAPPDATQRQLYAGVSPNLMPAMANEVASTGNSAMAAPPILTPEVQGMAGVGPTEEPEDVKNVLPHQNPLHFAAVQQNSSSPSVSGAHLFPTPEMNPSPQHQEPLFPQQLDSVETILDKFLGDRLRNEIKMENFDNDDLETEFSFEGLPDDPPEDDSNTDVSDASPEEKQDEQRAKSSKQQRKAVKKNGKQHLKQKKHSCPECGHKSYYFSGMVRHIKTHFAKGAFKEKSSLEAHQEAHMSQGDAGSSQSYEAMTSSAPMGKQQVCPTCGLSAATPESLFEHMIAHLEERPFKCQECDKTFRYKSHLALHQEMMHSQQQNLSAQRMMPRGTHGPSRAENTPVLLQPLSAASTSAGTYAAGSPSKLLLSRPEGEGAPLSRYGTKTVKVVLTKFAKLCNERKHTCPECGFVSESLSGIIQHRRVHTGEMPCKCNRCGQCFELSSELDKHCSRNACQQNSLPLGGNQMSYEGLEHPLPTIKMEEEEFEISPEGLTLSHEATLREYPREDSLPGILAAASSTNCRKKQHICSQCGYKARSLTDLVSHMRKHTKEKPYMCPSCGKTFAWKASLKKHVALNSCSRRNHAPNTSVSSMPSVPYISVAECDVTLSDEEELINILANTAKKKGAKVPEHHMKPSARDQQESSHSQEARPAKKRGEGMEKNLQCHVCGHKSYYISDLMRHQKGHGGSRPYQCPECWRAFSAPSACTKHFKTVHKPDGRSGRNMRKPIKKTRSIQKEKKHTCTKCGHETYKLSTHLIHMKSHASDRPFRCAKCGETFANQSNLNRHGKIHQRDLLETRKNSVTVHQQITGGSIMRLELKPLKVPVLSHMDDAKLAELRGKLSLNKEEKEEQAEQPVASTAKDVSSDEDVGAAEGDSAEVATPEDAKNDSVMEAEAEAEDLELAEIKAKVRARLERFVYSKGGETNSCPPAPVASQAAPVETDSQAASVEAGSSQAAPTEAEASQNLDAPMETEARQSPFATVEADTSQAASVEEDTCQSPAASVEADAHQSSAASEADVHQSPAASVEADTQQSLAAPVETDAHQSPAASVEADAHQNPAAPVETEASQGQAAPAEAEASQGQPEEKSEGRPNFLAGYQINAREETHECEVCGERFMWRATLLCHRARHTEAKPLACSECGEKFLRKDFLEAHEKTHRFECSKHVDECAGGAS